MVKRIKSAATTVRDFNPKITAKIAARFGRSLFNEKLSAVIRVTYDFGLCSPCWPKS
jgi:hypothetical protein